MPKTVTVTIPKALEWSDGDLAWLDPKTAGRVGPTLTFVRMLGIFLYNFKGPMEVVQACIRFQHAVKDASEGDAVEVPEDAHTKVMSVIATHSYHFEIMKKLMPHLDAITTAKRIE